jgi:hypothetical protein
LGDRIATGNAETKIDLASAAAYMRMNDHPIPMVSNSLTSGDIH